MRKLQKTFAMLMAVCMVMSLLSVTAFAEEAEKSSDIQIVEDGGKMYYLASGEEAGPENFDVWTSKTIAGTGKEDEFEITLQVGSTMKAVPNNVAVVLVIDASGSMMMDKEGKKWGQNGVLPTDGRKLRIDYAREAALEFAEQLVDGSGSAQRMLSVVEFGNNACTILPWTNANDNGALDDDVKEAIESVDVNFVYDNRSFWSPDLMMQDWGQVEYWSDAEYTHETKSYYEACFASFCQSFMTEYTTTMVTETVEETEVTRCSYDGCTETAEHTHCTYEGCTVPATHSHCTYKDCPETADHTHCTYEGCLSAVADHKHCTVCGVTDAEAPEDTHCTYEGCTETSEHTHCTYSICANPDGHQHCGRVCWCEEDHEHCSELKEQCGRTDEHTHVTGCTFYGCQDTTPNHIHACVHGRDGGYPYCDWYAGKYGKESARCLNPDPTHTHDVYDADTRYVIFDRVHQQYYCCGTNMEGGLMLARNLVNAGLAEGGAIEDIDDVYVIFLGDGNPTYHVNQSQVDNLETEVAFIPGERGGGNYSTWDDVVDIVDDSESEDGADIAIAEDIKDIAELYAILYGKELNGVLGGDHALSNVTGEQWFKGEGENYIDADAVFDSPEVSELNSVFAAIKDRIDVLAKAWVVTDEMGGIELGDDVEFAGFTLNGKYAAATPATSSKNTTVSWSLGAMEPESGTGGMDDPYIYTLKYKVKLNSAKDNVKETSLAYDADNTLSAVWTNNGASLQYFMVDKEQLDAMTPEQIAASMRTAAFDKPSVKGIYGDYEFIKKNGETGEVMEGVGFKLYDTAGKACTAEVLSDSEGKVTFADIPRGEYYLVETSTPSGMETMDPLGMQVSWGVVTTPEGGALPEVIYNYSVKENQGGGGGSSYDYYKVTVNYYDKETGESIAKSYTQLIREGKDYDVTDKDAIEISGYTYDSTTGDPLTGTMDSNKVINVYYVKGTADIPEGEVPTTNIPEGDVPTTGAPEGSDGAPVEELPEEEVPLASVPKTGDMSALWLALTALSGTGLAGVTFCKKRKEN